MKAWHWFPWLVFLVSACVIIAGGLFFLKTDKNIGIYITFAGFIGLALSGFLLTIVYGFPW